MSNPVLSNPYQPFPIQMGRDVMYVLANREIRAGKISRVHDAMKGIIDAHVMIDPLTDPPPFRPQGDSFVHTTPIARKIQYDAQNMSPNTWHWPNNTPPGVVPQSIGQAERTAPTTVVYPNGNKATTGKSAAPADPKFVDDGIMTSGLIYSMPTGIDAIMSLQEEAQDSFQRGSVPTAFAWMPIRDGQFPGVDWLDVAVETIGTWRARGWKVLIHCSDGQSRAALVDVAFHMKTWGWSRDEALSMIRARPSTNSEPTAKRAGCNPNPFFLQGLVEYQRFLHSEAERATTMPTPQTIPQANEIPSVAIGPAQPAGTFPHVSR